MADKIIEFDAIIEKSTHGGAFVRCPFDIKKDFGRGRLKVDATFDGVVYSGSIVNMGVKNPDGSPCYILGVLKEIRAKLGKQEGDTVRVSILPKEE